MNRKVSNGNCRRELPEPFVTSSIRICFLSYLHQSPRELLLTTPRARDVLIEDTRNGGDRR
jgi:hypothetical protein